MLVELCLDRLGLSKRIAVVCTGRQVLFCSAEKNAQPVILDAVMAVPPPEPPPSELPAEAQWGLTTKRHLSKDARTIPLFMRGEFVASKPAEALFAQGLKQIGKGRRRWGLKPVVMATGPFLALDQRKRAMVNLGERAGAGVVWLVEYPMACGLGLGLDLTKDEVHGVLAIEDDWTEFAAISYADDLCVAHAPVGVEQIKQTSGAVELLCLAIHAALDELREEQLQKLEKGGLNICGAGAANPAIVEAIRDALGLPVTAHQPPIHPALTGTLRYIGFVQGP